LWCHCRLEGCYGQTAIGWWLWLITQIEVYWLGTQRSDGLEVVITGCFDRFVHCLAGLLHIT
jgi:hypothetical protein